MIKVVELRVSMQCDWTALGSITNFCQVLDCNPLYEMKSELNKRLEILERLAVFDFDPGQAAQMAGL